MESSDVPLFGNPTDGAIGAHPEGDVGANGDSDSSPEMVLNAPSEHSGPPSFAPKLALAPPPLKKSKSAANEGRNLDEPGGMTDVPSGHLMPSGGVANMGPNLEAEPLVSMFTQMAERIEKIEGNLNSSLGRKLDAIKTNQELVLQTVDAHTSQIASLHKGLDAVKERMNRIEEGASDAGPHVQQLRQDLQTLTVKVQDLSSASGRTPSEPPSRVGRGDMPMGSTRQGPRARSAVPNQAQPDIDWNRLVIGGWLQDTRRDTIEREAAQLLEKIQVKDHMQEIIVFGRRASTCHVLLTPLPDSSARARISSWQTQVKNGFTLPSSSQSCWLTAHKSPQRRFKNRMTKHALDTLERLLGADCKDHLDCDWARQLIWLDDHRVACLRQEDLGVPAGPHLVHHHHYDERQKEQATIYFNAQRLAQVSGQTIEAVTTILAKDGGQE